MEALTPIWNSLIVNPLEEVLRFLAQIAGSGGIAIVLMTVLVKLILLPLSLKQTSSMKAIQAIQPEVAAIKKKFKDRERVTQETMKLYKERGINPAAGCLPMLPTMVVLFGLYWALTNLATSNSEGQCTSPCHPAFQEPFLWVHSLNRPDLLFSVPDASAPGGMIWGLFTISGLAVPLPGILPIAMAITQYFSSKMMTMPSADPQQAMMNRMMTIMMPAMMLFWGVTFPAGLVLYWFVSNVFEMVRLYFTMGPQSLQGSFPGFGSSEPAGAQPTSDGDGAISRDQTTSGNSAGDGPRANGRPNRPRSKRGKRSGRR